MPLQASSHLVRQVQRLSRADLPIHAAELARYLIGKTIVREIGRQKISGRIVETEAYPPGDASGHGYRGQTTRNQTLFLERGLAYVYFIYGTSYMLNVAAEEPGVGAGVLLHAIEPLDGINIWKDSGRPPRLPIWPGVQGGSRLHWKLISGWTALICVPTVRFGLGRPFESLVLLASRCE